MGLLYCRHDWADRITPVYLARFGVDLGGGVHQAARRSDNSRLMPGARRFDLGNHNYIGAAAAAESIDFLNEIGPKNIEMHVGNLTRQLADGLLALDLPVVGSSSGDHLTSLVCVGKLGGSGHDSTDDTEMSSLSQHLNNNKVQHSIRKGLIRLSLHIYNTEEDITDVIALARGWRDTKVAA